jgi:hypothetical protein
MHQYHDNEVEFISNVREASIENGRFRIDSFFITKDEDPDHHITNDGSFSMNKGKLTFNIGRKKSKETANWLYTEKGISPLQTTLGAIEKELNFALMGQLDLELKVVLNNKTRILGFIFENVFLAQGEWGGLRNIWCFGGKNCTSLPPLPPSERSFKVNCTGKDFSGQEYTFLFKLYVTGEAFPWSPAVNKVEILEINGKNYINDTLSIIGSATINTLRIPANGLTASNAIEKANDLTEIQNYFRQFMPSKYIDGINNIAYTTRTYSSENADPTILEYTMTSPNGEPLYQGLRGLPLELLLPDETHHKNMLLVPDDPQNALWYSAYRKSTYDLAFRVDAPLLNSPGNYSLVIPRSMNDHLREYMEYGPLSHAFFFQDNKNTFFVQQKEVDTGFGWTEFGFFPKCLQSIFETFYHPHISEFIRQLGLKGIEGLLNRDMQSKDGAIAFEYMYNPGEGEVSVLTSDISGNKIIAQPYPTGIVDFDYKGAYSQYNWELFFHIPLYIATKLSNNQKFEEARRWFHYIFDPTNTDGEGKERFWKFKPFYDEAQTTIQTINDLLDKINDSENYEQVKEWMENPFKPHAIARMRKLAYMKNVVMKYIDNLIAWADQLFRRDTIESINEATHLYILAAKILGDRPQKIPVRAEVQPQTFNSLQPDDIERLDAFSNAAVEIAYFISPSAAPVSAAENANLLLMHYFLLDKNEKLLQYWDTVADRLFKIRHSMNIEGIERLLPLFEPPIDPGLLVKAAAAGLSMNDVLNDISGASMPHYRFNIMLQKANELCADIKALGGAFLAALEKKDAEQLALIRQSQEIKILEATRYIKDSQIKELEENLAALHKSKEAAEWRLEYYSSRDYMNTGEMIHVLTVKGGLGLQIAQSQLEIMASLAAFVPEIKIGVPTTMGASFGGSNVSASLKAMGASIGILASINNTIGTLASIQGGYERRMDDWKFQAKSAEIDIEQIDKQILANEIRLAIANHELAIHDKQVENAQEIDEYMISKFTNKQLYDWMIGQLSTVYFQSYQLAYDLAKQAQKCYTYELGLDEAKVSFIQFKYWDSLKKGLLAGENLQYDLRRMEASYLQENKRDLELTKHISLALIAPGALLDLKKNGIIHKVSIPEALFDLDYPGHYFRRIKSVSITIPCVTGPFTTVNCTLRLINSYTRVSIPGEYEYDNSKLASSFPYNPGSNQTIACSSAQNDSGLFELNFRDERYLPFEGCGAISDWSLELTDKESLRQFDYKTISDVIFHLKYTAREGIPKSNVTGCLEGYLSKIPSQRVFSARHEFPTQWRRFINSPAGDGDAQLEMPVTQDMFPFITKGKELKISKLGIFVKRQQKTALDNVNIVPFMDSNAKISINTSALPGWLEKEVDLGQTPVTLKSEPWVLSLPSTALDTDIEDIFLCASYSINVRKTD